MRDVLDRFDEINTQLAQISLQLIPLIGFRYCFSAGSLQLHEEFSGPSKPDLSISSIGSTSLNDSWNTDRDRIRRHIADHNRIGANKDVVADLYRSK